MKKHDCFVYLVEKGVEFDTSLSAVELKKLIKDYIKTHETLHL
jgi:hypothetical protein